MAGLSRVESLLTLLYDLSTGDTGSTWLSMSANGHDETPPISSVGLVADHS